MRDIDIDSKDYKELKRIQESIPEDLKKRLVIKRVQAPTVNKVVSLALHDDSIPADVKEKLQHLKDLGYFNKKEEVINKSVQKKIDKYVNMEIAKSIQAGRLSKPADNSLFNKLIKNV
jgi:hypothetical protein